MNVLLSRNQPFSLYPAKNYAASFGPKMIDSARIGIVGLEVMWTEMIAVAVVEEVIRSLV